MSGQICSSHGNLPYLRWTKSGANILGGAPACLAGFRLFYAAQYLWEAGQVRVRECLNAEFWFHLNPASLQ